jgi:hypothetical protein
MDLPKWMVRLDAARHSPADYSDLLSVVRHHCAAHHQAEQFLGPYNARQRSNTHYLPPSKEQLREVIRQGGMNDLSYMAFLSSLVRFCEQTKGMRGLPSAHPSTLHSIQLPMPAFSLESVGAVQGLPTNKQWTAITVPSCAPLYVPNLTNASQVRFVIVRPKLTRVGTPSASAWEVLLFRDTIGYVAHWYDSTINPRYAGALY